MRESAAPASRMFGAPPADPSLIQQFSRRVAEDMTGRPLRVAGAVGRVAAKAGFPLRMSVGPARVGQGQVRPRAVAGGSPDPPRQRRTTWLPCGAGWTSALPANPASWSLGDPPVRGPREPSHLRRHAARTAGLVTGRRVWVVALPEPPQPTTDPLATG